MQLLQAKICNFRSLRDVTVDFGLHTAFIGGNGAGKSSILKALEKFYGSSRTLEPDDFYGRDVALPVEIALTFGNLTPEEVETFQTRVRDGRLTVTRVFDGSQGSGRYHGVVPSNPEFAPVRAIAQATPRRQAYNALRAENPKYADLATAANADQVSEGMRAWEEAHPDALELARDDGQFFGFQNAGRGALQRYTSFVFIPAVREAAADAADGKSSAIGRLLQIVVRSAILQRQDMAEFQQQMNTRYRELTSPDNMPELGALAGRLTTDLKGLYADAEVGLTWQAGADLQVPMPNADVTLSDDGFGGPVDRQGHGLQRAFIFTLLQNLARATQPQGETQEALAEGQPEAPEQRPPAQAPGLILGIEEPEVYQHPTKQRHFATVLRGLSNGTLPGADGRTQVAFASHSPMFVSMAHVDEIRFVRRADCEDGDFKVCELRALDLEEVARTLAVASQRAPEGFTAATLAPRLHILGSELSEGFFADGVVLVEGPSDRSALIAAALGLGLNFESAGIAVLPVVGKNNVDRPLLIFRELGIPTYPVWDCDKVEDAEANLRLLRAADPDSDHKAALLETRVHARYAHFQVNLEVCLRAEIGQAVYDGVLRTACEEFDAEPGRDAQKNPEIMKRTLALAKEKGAVSGTLEEIVCAIWAALKGTELAPAI
jgi:putative ATP-dependent endonuclease of OLD family